MSQILPHTDTERAARALIRTYVRDPRQHARILPFTLLRDLGITGSVIDALALDMESAFVTDFSRACDNWTTVGDVLSAARHADRGAMLP
jgi:hypothetical protein